MAGLEGLRNNRDFLSALADAPDIHRIVVVPRVMGNTADDVPCSFDHRTAGLGGVRAYAGVCTKVMLQERPSFVVCGHINLLPFAQPIAAFHRVPLAMLVFGIDVGSRPASLRDYWSHRSIISVTISQLTIDKMSSWSNTPKSCMVSLIPNGIDLKRFWPAREKPVQLLDRYQLHDKRILLTVARLVSRERYKGVNEVLELMPELLNQRPDIVYVVAGDGNDLQRLRTKAKSLDLGEQVVFTGRIPESEKLLHYQLADAFLMPGRGEGFGFVFLEAMACGIPVVASVLDGSREAVRYGALGQLCDPRDPSSILSAILTALGKGRGGRPSGLEYFDMSNFRRRVHLFASAALSN